MAYQTIWLAIYDSKNLIYWPLKKVGKHFFVDAISIAIILIIANLLKLTVVSYVGWFLLAIKVSFLSLIVLFLINLLFYKTMVYSLVIKVKEFLLRL